MKKILITAGPTREYLDAVRYISNPSSGQMGCALAAAALSAGFAVDVVLGPIAPERMQQLEAHPHASQLSIYGVTCAQEMLEAASARYAYADVFISAAAVSDMRPKNRAEGKVCKADIAWTMDFESTPDILQTLGQQKQPHQRVIGFAAQTDPGNMEALAREKCVKKNCDAIVANTADAFESMQNTVHWLQPDEPSQSFGPRSKNDCAEWIMKRIQGML